MTTLPIQAAQTEPPPEWALRQRHLIDAMNTAAALLPERYAREDGTFIWRDEFIGMDGSDDGYESYHNWDSEKRMIRSPIKVYVPGRARPAAHRAVARERNRLG
jgi:hypothetical protein